MDGGCISIWLKKSLRIDHRHLLMEYEHALRKQGIYYTFIHEYREPKFSTRYERRQVKRALGCEPQQEIQICGLATPMFRAAEAIMKYFGGYYQMHITDDIAQYLIGEYYAIRKRNKWGLPVYDYHLVDWEFISGYFNQMDDEKIRNVYSIERLEKFEKNEVESIWKSKPKYGLNYN